MWLSGCWLIVLILLLLLLSDFTKSDPQHSLREGTDTYATKLEPSRFVNSVGRGVRKLIGSNCLLIERGDYPPFYECVGCVIEEAQACIDDMRYNQSSNVDPSCAMSATSQLYDSDHCCPKIVNTNGRLDLQYIGAAYPMALRCVSSVGCQSSTIYTQLLKECFAVCPQNDPRNQQSVCYSQFNDADQQYLFPSRIFLTGFILLVLFLSIQ